MKHLHRVVCLAVAAGALSGRAQTPGKFRTFRVMQNAPASGPVSRRYTIAGEPTLTDAQKLALVRRHIKYVFVLFQENRSFDFYFGTYPGAYGLFSQAAGATPGFVQPLVDTDGTVGSISPFRIPPAITDQKGNVVELYPSDLASVNHSHLGMVSKLNLPASEPFAPARNDRYALTEEGVALGADGKPSKFPMLERKQYGELVMGHLDCDTAPFLWRYADRFTLFDHFFATVIGPSTPNAIAMISGQTGETQWVLHPEEAAVAKGKPSVPIVSDPEPFWEVKEDKVSGEKAKESNDPKTKTKALNLTFATLPLSFMGDRIVQTTATDADPAADLADVREDIQKIAGTPNPAVNWGWYQQGYDHEAVDEAGRAGHKMYIPHHNAPAYFGYIANNPGVEAHLHGLGDFFDDVAARRLPASGVFYVRGGYGNIRGWKPLDPNPKLATVFNGNDDHPGYSDSQLSEALLAEEINAIAQSPYWRESAILIAYDESDGLYDHAQPHVRSQDPVGLALSQGPRIPFLLLSPYGAAHAVSHEAAEHSSIIKFVDELFRLTPLADLPDERRARAIGLEKFGQKDLGPADDLVEGVGDLLSGFSNSRLMGRRPILPASYAEIPATEIAAFPHYGYRGCSVLGIRPTDFGRPNPLPADFNPRPESSPGNPSSGSWKP